MKSSKSDCQTPFVNIYARIYPCEVFAYPCSHCGCLPGIMENVDSLEPNKFADPYVFDDETCEIVFKPRLRWVHHKAVVLCGDARRPAHHYITGRTKDDAIAKWNNLMSQLNPHI